MRRGLGRGRVIESITFQVGNLINFGGIELKRTIIIFLILFLLSLISITFVSCDDEDKIDTVKIRLSWLHQAQYSGIYVAKSKGFFEKYGIKKVEILQGGPNIRPIDLVSSGSEHFSITGSTPFFRAYKENRPVKIVATLDQKHAFCYFARKDRGINTPYDFKGQRVGHKVMHEHNLNALLDYAELTKDDIELVSVPPGMSLFFIDDPEKAVPIWPGHSADEPIRAEERGIKVNYFFPEDYDNIPRIGNLLFTSKDFESKHPEIVKGVVCAIIEGWKYAFDNVEYAVNETMKYIRIENKDDREHQLNMLNKMRSFMITDDVDGKIGWCNETRWEKALMHFLNENPDAGFKLEDILTNAYVEAYYRTDEPVNP